MRKKIVSIKLEELLSRMGTIIIIIRVIVYNRVEKTIVRQSLAEAGKALQNKCSSPVEKTERNVKIDAQNGKRRG